MPRFLHCGSQSARCFGRDDKFLVGGRKRPECNSEESGFASYSKAPRENVMASSRWTATQIGPQSGKTALITGANSGVGYQAAVELARHGAYVLLGVRSMQKGAEALARLHKEAPGASAEVVDLDMASLGSIRRFAEGFARPLDVLINNAGVMALPTRELTGDGFERQFGTNHLGHFALTGLLMPKLLQTSFPRVVTVSSLAHRNGKIEFDNLQGRKKICSVGGLQPVEAGQPDVCAGAGPPRTGRRREAAQHTGASRSFADQHYRQWAGSEGTEGRGAEDCGAGVDAIGCSRCAADSIRSDRPGCAGRAIYRPGWFHGDQRIADGRAAASAGPGRGGGEAVVERVGRADGRGVPAAGLMVRVFPAFSRNQR